MIIEKFSELDKLITYLNKDEQKLIFNALDLSNKAHENQLRKWAVSGHMYLFEYDAKFAKKLPYYDSFPLVYVIKSTRREFWGMNLHYMSPKKRAWVVKRLMDG